MCLEMASGYIEPKKESLLKSYTNLDRIKDMTVDEMTEFLDTPICKICLYKDEPCFPSDCQKGIKHWLESEAER